MSGWIFEAGSGCGAATRAVLPDSVVKGRAVCSSMVVSQAYPGNLLRSSLFTPSEKFGWQD